MINRERELEWLTSHLKRDDRQFLVVYGRRRVGKTTLVTTALDSLEQETQYYLCDQRGPQHNATQFARQCADHFDDVPPDVDTFLDAFRYLKGRADGPFVVALDEFSYLVGEDETIPSVFQTIVDEVLADTDISIVLLGSSISMMEEGVLSYESPLYGRRTGQWRLEPLTIGDVSKFFPRYDADATIQTYSVLGGVPAYLEQFDGTQDLFSNIEQHILSKGAFLYEEPEFLLRQELREPTTYMAILEAIANGATRVTDIANSIDKKASGISRYLQNLTQLALVERETPVTDPDGRGVYKLTDQFVRFWFRYVSPNRGTLEQGRTEPVRESIAETVPTHTSFAFEEVCRQAARAPSFPVSSSRVGRWWYSEQEIDVVGLNPQAKSLFLGECKWTTSPVGRSLLDDLEATEPDVRWQGSDRDVAYGLFSRSGFTDELVERAAQREDVHLFTPSDVLALFE
ncbi:MULTISPECIES: ATP-binding protein [Haloferax]|uniref:Archaeal ATPase n=1 Tax=Haloferax massiliensis TaxID=1476858 RepID=A0A0D6JW09_9EURY|nr:MULTISPECIES: ATP-binding protein [Haloferax]MDS0241783.1 ATP-binding protein [Haloferax sp. S2CR25]MDS0444904.1 ATP-binding protein [Haloferax sp. S2CR25-2]CQR52704.1 Archaeal ATPase [Haloferax massiliensis]